jgi:hypothetical protein
MSHNGGAWNIWRDGPMPATRAACPMAIKMLLIASYRYNSYDEPTQAAPEKGAIFHVFVPLASVVLIWLATCVPSLLNRTRSRLGTTIHIVFGIHLAAVYWIITSVAIAYYRNVSILVGLTTAVHFAWICSPAHPDTIHGYRTIGHVMRAVIVIIVYYTVIRSPVFPHVKDGAFIFTIWGPEIINMIMDPVFATSVTALTAFIDTHSYEPKHE